MRIPGIQKHCHRGYIGHDLFQQLETLSAQFRRNDAEAGKIASRPCKIVHRTGCDWIADYSHNDRNSWGCRFECFGSRRPARDDDINIASRKISGKPGQRFDPVLPPFPFKRNGRSLDIAKLSQAIQESLGAQ